jgi:hypothetical protein
MGLHGYARALRAGTLACALAWFGSTTDLRAETSGSLPASDSIGKSAEPFGLFTSVLSAGGLRDKWLGVQHRLDDEMVQLALCEGDRENCVSPAALQFLAIVDTAKTREGRARLGEINRAINLAIRPMSDLAQYGQIDVWTSPLATLAKGAGDCEDYAIAKYVALRRCRCRRPPYRDHARHHARRGSCGRRGAARRALADTRQPPHGDGRGFRRQELPPDIRNRSA